MLSTIKHIDYLSMMTYATWVSRFKNHILASLCNYFFFFCKRIIYDHDYTN